MQFRVFCLRRLSARAYRSLHVVPSSVSFLPFLYTLENEVITFFSFVSNRSGFNTKKRVEIHSARTRSIIAPTKLLPALCLSVCKGVGCGVGRRYTQNPSDAVEWVNAFRGSYVYTYIERCIHGGMMKKELVQL